MGVIHHHRVAWEAARVFVTAADAEVYWWLTGMVGRHFGETYQLYLSQTRHRLRTQDTCFAEMGAWRARFLDLLTVRPDLAPILLELLAETSARMPRWNGTDFSVPR